MPRKDRSPKANSSTTRGGPPPLFKHQIDSVKFMSTRPRVLDASDPGCVSCDTEYLTPTGWKRIDQYTPGDLVAQFHPENCSIEFVEPIAYIKEPCAEMVAITPVRGTSQLLSPEHRVLWYSNDGSTFGEQSAEDFMHELHKKGPNHLNKKFMTAMRTMATGTTGLSDAELRVQVAFVADGHLSAKTPGSKGTVRLKKPRKIERMHMLLKAAGIEYRYRVQPSTGFTIFRFTPPLHYKHFPIEYHGLNQHELYIIGDEATYWDGSFDPRPSSGRRFSSMVKSDADIVQLAWAALGASTSVHWSEHGGYQVYASWKPLVGPGRKTSVGLTPSPDGFKYCFTVPSTFLYLRRNGRPFATGNTGKTRVQIELFAARRKRGGGAALVIAPKSLLRSAWQDDFKKFAPEIVTVVCTADKREQAFAQVADVYITNTDATKWLAQQPASFFKRFDTLIIDELSSFKHHTTQRSKALNKIKKYFKNRYGLTGTPNSNSITDIWHQIFVLDDGQRLGKSFYQFRNSVCQPRQVGPQPNMLQWEDKPGAELAVGQLLADMVVRHKFEECVDIPVNHTYSVPYHMSPKQAKAYQQMEKAAITQLANGSIVSAVNAAGVMTKLLQIASGASYTDGLEGESYVEVDNGRYELVGDLVEQRDYSVVFFNWAHQRDLLVKEFKKRGITYAVIDGKTSDKARKEAVDHFQAGFYRVLLAHPQSAAHGLTLTKGTATIWASPTYNLEHFLQGNRRIYRVGQTQKTETIVVLAPGTVEDKVFQKLREKDVRQGNMLNLLKELFQEEMPNGA